jgi:hypothetical protein
MNVPKLQKVQEWHPSKNHWIYKPGLFKERVTRSQLRQMLLGDSPIVFGEVREWKFKHLGVGVYEVWVE